MNEPVIDFDEELELVEYDPSWPDKYEREEARLEEALDGTDYVRIEHMGSTAVPGLDAKDAVDVLVVVPSVDTAWECVERLESIGYEFHREWNVRETRLALGRWPSDSQRFNLSIRLRDGDGWRRNLLLREYLRDHPEARERYEATKYEAVEAHADEPLEYTKAKSDTIDSILDDAREAGYDDRI